MSRVTSEPAARANNCDEPFGDASRAVFKITVPAGSQPLDTVGAGAGHVLCLAEQSDIQVEEIKGMNCKPNMISGVDSCPTVDTICGATKTPVDTF